MTIYFDRNPKHHRDVVLFCDVRPRFKLNCQCIDVRDIIQANQHEFTTHIVKGYTKLLQFLETKVPRWYFSPISRLMIWSSSVDSFQVRDIYIALAVNKFTKFCDQDIYIMGANAMIEKYTKLLTATGASSSFGTEAFSIISEIKYFKSLGYGLIVGFIIYFRNLVGSRNIKTTDLSCRCWAISTLFRNPSIMTSDHFYGGLFAQKTSSEDGLSFIYDNLNFWPSYELSEGKLGGRPRFLFSQISISDLFRSVAADFKQHLAFHHFFKKGSGSPRRNVDQTDFFTVDLCCQLGLRQTSFFQFLSYFTLRRLIKEKTPQTIIYPYEGKIREASILAAVKESKKNIRTVGFAHAGYSEGHLFTNFYNLIQKTTPDFFAVTGKRPASFFQSKGIDTSRILVTGTDRHKAQLGLTPKYFSSNRSRMRILFISSLGFEYLNFVKLLVNYPSITEDFDVYLRRSVHSWHYEQNLGDSMLADAGVYTKKADGDLIEEILASDIVLFEFTTAAYQASLLGRLIMKVKVYETFETDHFDNELRGTRFLNHCMDGDELISVLREISCQSVEEYEAIVRAQRQAVAEVYEIPNAVTIKSLIDEL